MTNRIKQLAYIIVITGLVAGFCGACKCPPKKAHAAATGDGEPGNTSGNSGSLPPIALTTFSTGNNGQGCFPTSAGWDRYYVLPGYLLGPNVTPQPTPNPYPNVDNCTFVTLDTCDPANGTSIETGIVIMYEFNPLDKVCASTSSCVDSSKLTFCTRSMATGKRYRAAVFYKSSTAGGLQNLKINWSYQ